MPNVSLSCSIVCKGMMQRARCLSLCVLVHVTCLKESRCIAACAVHLCPGLLHSTCIHLLHASLQASHGYTCNVNGSITSAARVSLLLPAACPRMPRGPPVGPGDPPHTRPSAPVPGATWTGASWPYPAAHQCGVDWCGRSTRWRRAWKCAKHLRWLRSDGWWDASWT